MTPARAALQFFTVTLTLLIAYTLVQWIALLALLPHESLTLPPFDQVSHLATALLDLAVVGGLIGGGIYALQPSNEPTAHPLLQIALLLWLLLALVTVAGALTPQQRVVAQAAVIALVLADLVPRVRHWTPIPLVWVIGIAISAVCLLIPLISPGDFLQAAFAALARALNVHVGETLAALALANWLLRRFSTVSSLWADLSLKTLAGLLALAGTLLSLVILIPLGFEIGVIGTFAALLVPLIYLIAAAHSYLPLANRNTENTLAAHWMALGVLLFLAGVGLTGGIQSLPAVQRSTVGTWLGILPERAALFALVAIILGMINQIAAELRADHRRITGLMPFWLVAFGMVGGVILQAGIGLVQVYVERLVGVRFQDAEAMLAPLYALAAGASILVLMGLLIYGFLFLLRKPRAGSTVD